MKNKKISYFKNFSLLFKCLLSSIAFSSVWAGIAVYQQHSFGLWLIIGGALICFYSLFDGLILPLRRLK